MRVLKEFFVSFVSCVSLISLSGCQSGIVGGAYFNDDRSVLAFSDQHYDTIYLAKGEEVWQVGSRAPCFMLSPSGKHLLMVRFCEHKVYLYDVSTRKTWSVSTRKDFCDKYLIDMTFLKGSEPGFCLMLTHPVKTGWSKDWEYWTWREGQGWRKMESDPPPFKGRWRSSILTTKKHARGIIQLKPENGKARRTVWLRNDGSVMELLRQNDVPANLPFAVATLPLIALPSVGLFLWAGIARPTALSVINRWPDISEAQFREIIRQQRSTGSYEHPRANP